MGDMQGEFQNTFRPVGEQSDRHPDPAGMCRNFPTHTVLVQKEWLDEVNFVATPTVNLVNLSWLQAMLITNPFSSFEAFEARRSVHFSLLLFFPGRIIW